MLDIILNEQFILWAFIIFAIVTPIVCYLIYTNLKRKGHSSPKIIIWLLVVGAFGPANLILWHVYNAIENALGLDSVLALLINLALFVLLALIAGYLLSRLYTKLALKYIPPEHPDESTYNPDKTSP